MAYMVGGFTVRAMRGQNMKDEDLRRQCQLVSSVLAAQEKFEEETGIPIHETTEGMYQTLVNVNTLEVEVVKR